MNIDLTSQAIRVTAIVAALSPLLIAVFNQTHWSTQVKQIIAVVISGAVGVIVALTSGQPITWANAGALALVAIGAAQLAYAAIWKPLKVAPKIESATNASPTESGTVGEPEPIADDVVDALVPSSVALPEPISDEDISAAGWPPAA